MSNSAETPPPNAPEEPAVPKPGIMTRFFWFCAGADATLLVRCPITDWVKFQGVGGIVFATAVLAFASGSYAFYTVFQPKDETALSLTTDPTTMQIAMGAGLVWALVIFNIDRFIVSSTGKGDGTDKITFQELVQSMPRLLMAAIIGICISAPLEIRILKPEIDAQLELEQNEYLAQLNAQSEQMTQSKKDELLDRMSSGQKRLDERASYFETRRLEIKEQRRLLELEAEGKTKSAAAGRGPAWKDKKETLDKMEEELAGDLAADEDKNRPIHEDLDRWKGELTALSGELDAAKASNVKQARHLDGLMKRIHISHEIGGYVPLFIMLLLLAIETGPIFFKMMLTKGAYDYLQENAKRLATAHSGVEPDAQLYIPETNQEIRIDVYHRAEARIAEERRRLESEAALAAVVHRRFREETEREIVEGDGYEKYVERT